MNKGITKIIDSWARKGMDKIHVCCSCIGADDHFFSVVRDRECPTEFYLDITKTATYSFWGRVCWAWRYIWNGPWCDSIVVEEEEIKELGKALMDILHIKSKSEEALDLSTKVSKLINRG